MGTDPEETAMTPGRFLYAVYVVAGLILCIGFIAMGMEENRMLMLNFIVGGVFSMGMVRSTHFLVQQFLTPSTRLQQHRVWLMVFLLAKFPIILVFLALVAWSAWFDVTGFVIGVSLMPLLIIGFSFVSVFTGNSPLGQIGLVTSFAKQAPLKNSVRR